MRINIPLRIVHGKTYVNERSVERAFCNSVMPLDGDGLRVLDFGSYRSCRPIQLAALGYEVVAVDLQGYPLEHPNLTTFKGNIVDYPDERFDWITAVSTIEHAGSDRTGLDEVMEKLRVLLAGKMVATVPVGQPYEGKRYRSFDRVQLADLFCDFDVETERLYCRDELKFWRRCGWDEAHGVSNRPRDTGYTGVNAVGCFVLR